MRWILIGLAAASLALGQSKPAAKKSATKKAPAARPAATAAPSPASAGVPLAAVEFKGNSTYTAAQLMSAAGLKLGQPMRTSDFDAMRERLLATGALDGVGYEYKPSTTRTGYELTVEVREFSPVLDFRFEELPAADAELRAHLKSVEPLFDQKIPSNKPVLDRFAEHLRAYSVKKGLNDTVIAKVVSDAPDQLTVLFRPGTEPLRVAQTKFKGDKAIDNGLLTRTFNGVAIGRICQEPLISSLLITAVKPLYETRGMLAVKFPKVEISKLKDVEGCEAVITVEEGPVFTYGEISATGAGAPAEWLKIAALKSGETVNFELVTQAEKNMLQAMKNSGYMRAQARSDRSVREKTKSADIHFQLTPGELYHFGRLNVKGLDIQNEPNLRKLWGLKPGAKYRADYPQYFLDQLREQNLFDNLKEARYEIKLDDAEKLVDLTLYFVGGKPQPSIPSAKDSRQP